MANYFTIQELCKSDTANKYKINNTPSSTVTAHLLELVNFLNPLREAWGSAICVTSGYRCPQLNKLVGGASSSVHKIGYAADLVPKNGRMNEFKKFVKNYLKDKKFDQCIIEKNARGSEWIHIGLKNNWGLQRKQIFNLITS